MKFNKFFIGTMLTVACTMAFTACDPTEGDDPFGPNPNPNPNPTSDTLTVAQAIAKQDGKEALVKGYIVGWYNNKSAKVEFSNQNAADTTLNKANVIIADAADITDATQVVCVQLTAGPVRDLVNLGTNPDNLGKRVVVKGILQAYNTLPGLKSTSYAEINGKKSTDPVTEFYCFRVGVGSIAPATASAMKVGDKVVIKSKIIYYKGTKPETVWQSATAGGYKGTILSINGTTPAEAISATEAIAECVKLGPDVVSTSEFTIAGEVTKVEENGAEKYGNMTFYIK